MYNANWKKNRCFFLIKMKNQNLCKKVLGQLQLEVGFFIFLFFQNITDI